MFEPIFIVGCERSGTTLLRIILNQSAELHIPGESWFLKELSSHCDSYGDFSQPHQRWFFIRDLQLNHATKDTYSFDIFQLTLLEAEAALKQVAPTDFFGAAASLFQASAHKQGKPFWADKTPRHVTQLDWLAQAYPKAKFVHVLRDGRDVALSLMKAGWEKSIKSAASRWQQRVSYGTTIGSKLGNERYYELKYEDLVTQPELSLRKLCTWLGIEYSPDMLQHHTKTKDHINRDWHLHARVAEPINGSRAFAWKKKLTRIQVAEIEHVAGALLDQLDYELTSPKLFTVISRVAP